MSVTAKHQRKLPGRVVGVSVDPTGRPAYRLAIQTREQHIRRAKATSNICTAQVLLAIMASMYGVYHGPAGLTAIARRVRAATGALASVLSRLGATVDDGPRFDTLRVRLPAATAEAVERRLDRAGINLRRYDDGFGIALDETVTRRDLAELIGVFSAALQNDPGEWDLDALAADAPDLPAPFARTSSFLTHPVFNSHHSETEMLRYIHKLQAGDLSLAFSMIALGSCTMKLNGTSQMLPVTWGEFGNIHPFAPREQWRGYAELFDQLERWLGEITGFAAVSLQPNAGSQGEYAGLLTIKAWQEARGETGRDVCLIPASAHGTNPASAVMAGFRVVGVACDEEGNIDVEDLRARAAEHRDQLGALMVTYPSTHGVFEESIRTVCDIVHDAGGRVYLDGANMNAQVGLCRPADYGADVCHLNLHKTFCIPHGGGGPGMGPIGVTEELAPFLPGHPLVSGVGGEAAIGPVSAAPYGSPSILPIPWMYIATMGAAGLKRATQIAILNANYMANRLSGTFEVLYRGPNGRVAHEFILEMRPYKVSSGVSVTDIAKRLMDYGFHAPTVSFPVVGTLMIEPTESESLAELDRFCDALISIRGEIRDIEEGRMDREDNPLKRAPHTALDIASESWDRGYSRELAAYPAPWVRAHKFWPLVGRIDEAYGDRNLMCTCPPVSAYS
jgi:glycine dehydrogenase